MPTRHVVFGGPAIGARHAERVVQAVPHPAAALPHPPQQPACAHDRRFSTSNAERASASPVSYWPDRSCWACPSCTAAHSYLYDCPAGGSAGTHVQLCFCRCATNYAVPAPGACSSAASTHRLRALTVRTPLPNRPWASAARCPGGRQQPFPCGQRSISNFSVELVPCRHGTSHWADMAGCPLYAQHDQQPATVRVITRV